MSDASKYRNFFVESPEGQQYVRILKKLITSNHQKAEQSPELARDFAQRAKGLREALDMTTSLSSDIKKPGTEEPDTE